MASSGAALTFGQTLLGGPISEAELTLTVDDTGAQSILNDPDCVGVIVINVGGETAYAGLSQGVSSSDGILLGANGGGMSMDVTRDFTLPSRQWWFIGTSATATTLYILRIRRYALSAGG